MLPPLPQDPASDVVTAMTRSCYASGRVAQCMVLLFGCLLTICASRQPITSAAFECGDAQYRFSYNGATTPCLNDVLKKAQHFNGSSVCIELQGTFILQPEDVSNESGALNLVYENVMIQGVQWSNIAVINCNESLDSGLGFTGSNISLVNLRFMHCGARHKSTSKGTPWFRSALYFERVHSLTLASVIVSNSKGVGTTMFNVAGKVNMLECSFTCSGQQNRYPGGAGLYIEFTYCDPGAIDNCTHPPMLYNSHSQYNITQSQFVNNIATTVGSDSPNFTKPQGLDHQAFGRGGGLSIFFKGNATGNQFIIEECLFTGNTALWGGGLFIEFQDNTRNNSIVQNGGVIDYNGCSRTTAYYQNSGTAGGGSRIGFIALDGDVVEHNSVRIVGVNYTVNQCMIGGGVAFYSSRETIQIKATNRISFTNCHWQNNWGVIGAAVNLHSWLPVTEGVLPTVAFDSCTFSHNAGNYSDNETLGYEGTGVVYVDSFPVEFGGDITFDSNVGSALAVVVTGIDVKKDSVLKFVNNTGIRGGAVRLLGFAYLRVSRGAQLHFINNTADFGGAIYAQYVGNSIAVYYVNCFLRPVDYYANPEEWNFTVSFANNCARMSGNDIHATSLIPCLWPYTVIDTKHWLNATKELFQWEKVFIYHPGECWNSAYNRSISTDATRFSLNGEMEHSFYPGETVNVPILTLDDLGANLKTILMSFVEPVEGGMVDANVSWLTYSEGGTVKVRANKTSNQTKVRFQNIGEVLFKQDVTFHHKSCLDGSLYSHNSHMCECGNIPINERPDSEIPYPGLVACNDSFLTLDPFRWAGRLNGQKFAIGYCPVGYCDSSSAGRQQVWFTNATLPNLCKTGREGTLCGKCSPGYSPQVVTMGLVACVECHWLPANAGGAVGGVVLFLLLEVVPVVLFCVFLLFMRLSITHGWLHSLVFYSQVLPPLLMSIDYEYMYPPLGMAYDIWQLNFLGYVKRYVCMFPTANAFEVVAAEASKAAVVLITLLVALYLIRQQECCFSCLRSAWAKMRRGIRHCTNSLLEQERPTVDGFVTALIICYGKLIQVSFTLLSFQTLYTTDSDNDDRLTVQMSRIQGEETWHMDNPNFAPYVIAATVVVILSTGLPLLLFYNAAVPMCLTALRLGEYFIGCQRITPFLDSFYKGFKPQFRMFSAFYLIYRIGIWSIFAFFDDKTTQVAIFQLALTSILGIHCLVQPFQDDLHNWLETANLLLLTLINGLKLYGVYQSGPSDMQKGWDDAVRFIFVALPALCLFVYFGWRGLKVCIRKLRRRHRNEYMNMEGSSRWERQQEERDGAFKEDGRPEGN